MLKRLEIRNFRTFKALEIDQLSRLNLIAGKNNAGKTSLLEAIFLLSSAGNAQMAINAAVIRGLDPVIRVAPAAGETPWQQPVNDPAWKQLFSDLDMSKPIEIEGCHTSHGQLALEITSKRSHITDLPLDRAGGLSMTNLLDERSLTFRYRGPKDEKIKSHIRVKEQGFEIEQSTTHVPFPATILLSRVRNIQEDAMRLGMLRKQKRGDMVLKALQAIEPKLQSIEDNSASGVPMIWGDIGLSELVPLPVMGEGMTQMARLILAISSVPDGVVLIDEIENGLHHSALSDVWRVIDEAAGQFRTQVFATTHSFECIEAAHHALGPDGFLLHRLEVSDSENRCVTYSPESMDATIRHGFEVR